MLKARWTCSRHQRTSFDGLPFGPSPRKLAEYSAGAWNKYRSRSPPSYDNVVRLRSRRAGVSWAYGRFSYFSSHSCMFQATLFSAGRAWGPVSSEVNTHGVTGKNSEIAGTSALYSLARSEAAWVRCEGSSAALKATIS